MTWKKSVEPETHTRVFTCVHIELNCGLISFLKSVYLTSLQSNIYFGISLIVMHIEMLSFSFIYFVLFSSPYLFIDVCGLSCASILHFILLYTLFFQYNKIRKVTGVLI